MTLSPLERSQRFAKQYGLRVPILLAPMAGACPTELSVAVMRAGGMGACGALLMQPDKIIEWSEGVRQATSGSFQLNTWIPDPPATRDHAHEARIRAFLSQWGPEVSEHDAEVAAPDFTAQCDAMLQLRPRVVSSIMGLYSADYVKRLKEAGIAWFATVTTVDEAVQAEAAGADVIVAQGMEAGGHRGAFNANDALNQAVGLFALLPAVTNAVNVPVVATGGISDARTASAALLLGASAVQMGTGFLRSPEAGIASAWSDGLGRTLPEDTQITRAFSGRPGRSIRTAYVRACLAYDAPDPAPYPIQRNLTQAMRTNALNEGCIDAMQTWAGQSAAMASASPATVIVESIWDGVQGLLSHA